MTDLQSAIERVEAASAEMERALAGLRAAGDRRDLTLSEQREKDRAHNRARRSVA
jgi:hypothetical protein